MSIPPALSNPPRRWEFRPRLWLQVVPLRAPVTAYHEWVNKMHLFEKSPQGRRLVELLDSGEIPPNVPEFHKIYGYGKQEAAIDWVRGEMMCERLRRPFVWHISPQRLLWWCAAFRDEYHPLSFFGGAKLERLKNKNSRWSRSRHIKMGCAHVGMLTSPSMFHMKFNRTNEVVFVDFPLRADMVRQAIDLTLRHNSLRDIHVYFLCMEGTLDERVARMMRDEVHALYCAPDETVALIETS